MINKFLYLLIFTLLIFISTVFLINRQKTNNSLSKSDNDTRESFVKCNINNEEKAVKYALTTTEIQPFLSLINSNRGFIFARKPLRAAWKSEIPEDAEWEIQAGEKGSDWVSTKIGFYMDVCGKILYLKYGDID